MGGKHRNTRFSGFENWHYGCDLSFDYLDSVYRWARCYKQTH